MAWKGVFQRPFVRWNCKCCNFTRIVFMDDSLLACHGWRSWHSLLTLTYFFGPLLLWGCENIYSVLSWFLDWCHCAFCWSAVGPLKLSPTWNGNLAVFQAKVVPEQQQVRRWNSRIERYVAFANPDLALQSFSRLVEFGGTYLLLVATLKCHETLENWKLVLLNQQLLQLQQNYSILQPVMVLLL